MDLKEEEVKFAIIDLNKPNIELVGFIFLLMEWQKDDEIFTTIVILFCFFLLFTFKLD